MLQLGEDTTINGYTFSRFELQLVREWRDWIKERLPDPMAIPERLFNLLPPEEQVARYKEAESVKNDLRSFSLASELSKRYLNTEEGGAAIARILLKKHHPEITEAEAFRALLDASPHFGELMEKINGKLPAGNAPAPAA